VAHQITLDALISARTRLSHDNMGVRSNRAFQRTRKEQRTAEGER
jgi:hypothetical protein